MSLKAKLEAVIYAAEEPVTLAQLAILFADEALEWMAEQQAALAAQSGQSGDASAADSEAAHANGEFQYPPIDAAADAEALPGAGAEFEADAAGAEAAPEDWDAADPDISPDRGSDASAEANTGADKNAANEAAAEDPVAEARRAARQRDREVRAILRQILDELIAAYASDGRGVEIREIAGGFRMATKPECHDAVRAFVKSLKPALKLSLPALETLAVIAYKQPVTAPEVNEIRGVDASGVFGSLLARKLIATAGRKQVIGRPILYKTTREFLLRFGLKDLSELPSMEEFEKMAATEFEELETAESAPSGELPPAPASDFDESASQDQASEDQASEDQASQDQASQDQASQDQASQDQASQDQASQDQASQDQASQDQASQDQASQDQASQDQASEDQAEDGPANQTAPSRQAATFTDTDAGTPAEATTSEPAPSPTE